MNSIWKTAVAGLILTGSMVLAQAQPAAAGDSGSTASNKMVSATPDTTAPAPPANVPAASQGGPEYVIGAEDVLHIAVWKEADLTATLPVRPDGKISLPLLNDVQAAGLTPEQLSASVTDKLKKYIADPHVTVVVTQINSKRIYLIGEVSRAGATPMLPNMTVMQALSSAGLNQFAKTKGIYVLRTENGKQEKLPVNYRKLVKGQQLQQNYLLKPGDEIVVP